MGFILFPDLLYKSTYQVDFDSLYAKGIRVLLFDIDNTLVGHGEPMDERAAMLIDRLRGIGFKLVMVSNNRERRVKSFCSEKNLDYVYKAGKPGKEGYLKAMNIAGGSIGTTAFIGDQIFTDIAGAKNCGMLSILVRPLYKKEEIQIVFKRFLEVPVLAAYSIKKYVLKK